VSETTVWPFVQAKYFKALPTGQRKVRVIVIHDMEAKEANDTAEKIAKYFQNPDYPSSAHICVDNNSVVQCVKDSHIAYAAPGCNSDGIQVELAGYGKQTREEWLDAYGLQLLGVAADAVAQYCTKYGIPAVHLTNTELKDGKRGIVGHYQVSQVYKKSDHSDPGVGFPWEWWIHQVQSQLTPKAA
jgi:N-acetyl-anhydromuramyl-L-alanine amidase AmpD